MRNDWQYKFQFFCYCHYYSDSNCSHLLERKNTSVLKTGLHPTSEIVLKIERGRKESSINKIKQVHKNNSKDNLRSNTVTPRSSNGNIENVTFTFDDMKTTSDTENGTNNKHAQTTQFNHNFDFIYNNSSNSTNDNNDSNFNNNYKCDASVIEHKRSSAAYYKSENSNNTTIGNDYVSNALKNVYHYTSNNNNNTTDQTVHANNSNRNRQSSNKMSYLNNPNHDYHTSGYLQSFTTVTHSDHDTSVECVASVNDNGNGLNSVNINVENGEENTQMTAASCDKFANQNNGDDNNPPEDFKRQPTDETEL